MPRWPWARKPDPAEDGTEQPQTHVDEETADAAVTVADSGNARAEDGGTAVTGYQGPTPNADASRPDATVSVQQTGDATATDNSIAITGHVDIDHADARNELSGTVFGPVVQARTVKGGVHTHIHESGLPLASDVHAFTPVANPPRLPSGRLWGRDDDLSKVVRLLEAPLVPGAHSPAELESTAHQKDRREYE